MIRYYILNQEVSESKYQDYMAEFEQRKNYIQMALNNEIEIDSVPEKYRDEVARTIANETLSDRATAYDILMGVSE